MSEQEKPFYKINEWNHNYNPACSFFENLWISPKWIITIEEIQENILSIVAHHDWKDGKNLITHLQVQFERKKEEWFFTPLFSGIWRLIDSILKTQHTSENFDLKQILQNYHYKILNLATKNTYTYTWKDEEWWYVYKWNNWHYSSILISSKKVA
jgi:hypothetical protein